MIQESYIRVGSKDQFECDNICYDIIDDNFTATINSVKYTIKLSIKSKKYYISCLELENDYMQIGDQSEGLGISLSESSISIIEYINESQCFRIIFENPRICYYGGGYYRINLKLGKDFDKDKYKLGQCIWGNSKLNEPLTEKGLQKYYTTEMDTWDPSSLFGIISSLGKNDGMESCFTEYIDEYKTILICDDMGKECCDFILCNTEKKKVVFIHAKADIFRTVNGARVATSKLHEVCAQAIKNLVYLSSTNVRKPTHYKRWNKKWVEVVDKKRDIKKVVKNRLCLEYKTTDPDELWNEIDSVIKNPNSDREVWLFLGNIYSKSTFEKKLKVKAEKIDAVALQGYYLLNSTMNQVGSIGAKFKVFCGL